MEKLAATVSLSVRTKKMTEWTRKILSEYNFHFCEECKNGIHFFVFDNIVDQNDAFIVIKREAELQKTKMKKIFQSEMLLHKFGDVSLN